LWHKELNKERSSPLNDKMQGSYLGPSFNDTEIEKSLIELGAIYKKFTEEDLLRFTAQALSEEKTIGWFQGRMEFGPRALGARSIIADPRSDKMQKILNLKVKFRESFRPFAPSIIKEDLSEWFELSCNSPYMLLVANVRKSLRKEMTNEEKKLFGINKLNVKRSDIPAVTHVDYSARIQTVHKETNPKYYKLLQNFKKITNCPILVNTSFNVRGEPIVCTILDAYRCFMGTDLDMLVCGNFILHKNQQNIQLKKKYENKFSLD
jgi:carbamoyltransferase|tara:strand:- start:169 stop:960 length:792 start_codon:yes stop_codon:yes gene_type:complete